MSKFVPMMMFGSLLALGGCDQKEPSRTFQTSTFLCSEEGASTKIDGKQLVELVKSVPTVVQSFSSPTFSGLVDDKGKKLPAKEVEIISLKLLKECRAFLDRDQS